MLLLLFDPLVLLIISGPHHTTRAVPAKLADDFFILRRSVLIAWLG